MPEPEPGQFTLIANVVPALPAGDYALTATQTVTAGNAHVDPLHAAFTVTAPRYVLPPDQVLSTFPPHRAAGAFSTRLPQVVLRRRTLPWERSAATGAKPAVPWLALVVLAEGEGELKTGVPIAGCVTAGVPMPGRADAEVGDALIVSNRVVKTIFPAQDELALLAHVRQVDLTDTELALGDDDGKLAVVVANRLPLPGKAYGAFLVSIENQLASLVMAVQHETDDGMTHGTLVPPVLPMLTFPVLAHWSFACVGEGDFQSLMQGLDVGMLGTLPAPAPAPAADQKPPPPPRPNPPETLFTGHVGLDATSRAGEATRAWYRGPLAPHFASRKQPDASGKLPLLHSSDQARRLGKEGREDLSIAAAFEIGRLLALAEPAVVAALLLWRKERLDVARRSALLAAEPALAALRGEEVGSGFAARAGLELLRALGANGALRLGATVGPVERDVLAGAEVLRRGLEELGGDGGGDGAGDGLAALRAAVEQATARLAAADGGGERR